MKVNSKYGHYYVKWEYTKGLPTKDKKQLMTCCLIFKVIENLFTSNELEQISSFYTRCSSKDIFSKDEGRKQSLKGALNRLTIQGDYYKDHIKEIRALFWEAYRTMTKTPRWEKYERNK